MWSLCLKMSHCTNLVPSVSYLRTHTVAVTCAVRGVTGTLAQIPSPFTISQVEDCAA